MTPRLENNWIASTVKKKEKNRGLKLVRKMKIFPEF